MHVGAKYIHGTVPGIHSALEHTFFIVNYMNNLT